LTRGAEIVAVFFLTRGDDIVAVFFLTRGAEVVAVFFLTRGDDIVAVPRPLTHDAERWMSLGIIVEPMDTKCLPDG
jgi:hypothetical protein